MKMLGYLKGRSEGQVAGPFAGLVVGVVILFVGLFMISVVSEAIPNLRANVFTTVSNTTAITAGTPSTPGNDTYHLAVGAIVDPSPDYIVVNILNVSASNGTWNVNVSLNRINVATIAIPATLSTTNVSGAGIVLVANALNNLTFGNETGVTSTDTTRIVNASIVYASSETNTPMGDISDSTITTTGTVFSVLGLVIIVIALSMAIQALRKEVA